MWSRKKRWRVWWCSLGIRNEIASSVKLFEWWKVLFCLCTDDFSSSYSLLLLFPFWWRKFLFYELCTTFRHSLSSYSGQSSSKFMINIYELLTLAVAIAFAKMKKKIFSNKWRTKKIITKLIFFLFPFFRIKRRENQPNSSFINTSTQLNIYWLALYLGILIQLPAETCLKEK